MHGLSARIYSLISVLVFIISSVFRAVVLLFKLSDSLNIAFYFLLAIGGMFAYLGSITKKPLNTFDFKNKSILNIASYGSAIGFFIDFIMKAISIYSISQNSGYKSFAVFIPLGVACIMALACSFYFFAIGMSYSDFGYDFRKLKLLHIVPIIWAISNALCIMTEAISPLLEVDSVIKYATYVASILYFYFLAREVENMENTKKAYLVASSLFSYFTMMFFVDRALMLLTRNADFWSNSNLTAISIMLISLFALFHQGRIKKGA